MPGAERLALAVLDASVAVRSLIPEAGTKRAIEVMQLARFLIAPRLLATECAATIRRKFVGGEVTLELAERAITLLTSSFSDNIIRLADDETFVASAFAIAIATSHKLPDCMYLALAERESAPLATADEGLARVAQRRGIAVLFVANG